MKVALRIVIMGWKKLFVAPWAAAIYMLISVMQTGLALGVWIVAERSGLRGSVDPKLLFTYFLYIILFQAFVWSGIARRIGDTDIRTGSLGFFLLKPYPYIALIFSEEVSWRIFRSLITLPVFIVGLICFRSYIQVQPAWFWVSLLLFPLAYAIVFLIQTISGILAFWFEHIDEFVELIEVFMLFFSGAGIPLFLLPPVLKTVSMWLPFQYALYVPTMIALGKQTIEQVFGYLGVCLVWIALLYTIFWYLWKRGLRVYCNEGQ